MKTKIVIKNKRAVIYIRVSTKEQLLGRSIETQKTDCIKYCQDAGFEVVEIFIEKGESAKNEDRTELQHLLAYCRKNKNRIGYLIIWKVDRLARNVSDYYEIRKTLMVHGISIRSATEPAVNGDDITAEAMEGLLAIWARLDNKIKSDRSKANMEAQLLTGVSPWYLGLGYLRSHNKKNGRKKTKPDAPDPKVLPVIARGLEEFAAGMHTVNSLARRFREWKLDTATGKKVYPQLTYNIITNIKFAGYLRNPATGELIKGQHQAAISLETFQKNQLILAGKSVNAKPRERANEEFPLRNFARCAQCGETLTGSGSRGRGGRYPYYHCKKRGCSLYGKTISKKELEDSFIALLQQITPTDEALILFKEVALDVWETKKQELNNDVLCREMKVAELNAEMREVISMKARGLITEEQFLEQKSPLEEEILAAKVALNEVQIEEWDIETAIAYAINFMKDLPRQWADYTLEQKQRFQQLVFPEGIKYARDKGMLEPKLSPIYEILQGSDPEKFDLVPPERIELPFPP